MGRVQVSLIFMLVHVSVNGEWRMASSQAGRTLTAAEVVSDLGLSQESYLMQDNQTVADDTVTSEHLMYFAVVVNIPTTGK